MRATGDTSQSGELEAAWRDLRRTRAPRLREVACVGASRTLLLAELGPADAPVVALAAGVHGDERAAPWALLSAVRDGLLDERFAYRIWPCTNPSGYRAGTRVNAEGTDVNRSFGRGGRSPEARAILTANRDRRFALAIDLHEDLEADGFYLYEPHAPGYPPSYAEPVTAALVEAGLPLQVLDRSFELGPPGSEVAQTLRPGIVLVDAPAERPFFGGDVPLGLVLLGETAPAALTFESPGRRPWDERIAAHRVALVAALAHAAKIVPATARKAS